MKLIADENCDRLIIAALRETGFDVASVQEQWPSVSDNEIFTLAIADGRVLLTNDQGFGRTADWVGQKPPAIVLMRLDPLLPATRTKVAVDAFATLKEQIPGQFIVIEPHQIRIRLIKY
jgi:predicted nuclease of predicted toxin-antitoxin system